MSEPTLKDVLDALTQMRAEMAGGLAKVDARIDSVRAEMASGLARVDARIDSVRAEMAGGLARVDARIDSVRAEMATKSELAKVEAKVDTVSAKVDAHRAETSKWFAALRLRSERTPSALEDRIGKIEPICRLLD